MNIYRISQTRNSGYDTYDSAVVVASSAEAARIIAPGGGSGSDWAPAQHVSVQLLGRLQVDSSYAEGAVVCASYNAG